jgi:hypothetical protein
MEVNLVKYHGVGHSRGWHFIIFPRTLAPLFSHSHHPHPEIGRNISYIPPVLLGMPSTEQSVALKKGAFEVCRHRVFLIGCRHRVFLILKVGVSPCPLRQSKAC